jgi:hypothetical protein
MRKEPTWRIPVGILALVGVLLVYGGLVARYVAPWLMPWPVLAQTVAYACWARYGCCPCGAS